MSDAPRGVDGGLETSDVGWYIRLGGENRDNLGFGWQIGYIDNGGTLRPGQGSFGTPSDWHAVNIEADYKWKDWLVLGQFYGGRTRNYSPLELSIGIAGFDMRRIGFGSPFPNVLGADTDSDSMMGLISYAWDPRTSLTLRYENAYDQTGAALIGGHFWTGAFNHRAGTNGMIQVEYITASTRTRSDLANQNDIDINDDLAQINYRLQF